MTSQTAPSGEPIADLPIRQFTRLRAELAQSSAQMTLRTLPTDLRGVEFGVITRLCLPEWTRSDGVSRPEAPERAIPIRRMALMLRDPPETTRRRVNRMRDAGLLHLSPAGVSLAPTAACEAIVRTYLTATHDLFIRLIEDMAATTDLDLPVAPQPRFTFGDVVLRALDTILLPIDTFYPVGAFHAFLLWGALTAVAVRDVTYDPVLSRRYAATIPPDAVRRSVSLRRLAAAMPLPYATAWRQMKALHEAGLVTRVGPDRWTVLTANLLEPSVRDITSPPSVLLARKVRELALLGLDPARAADHYRAGRPALADLGID